MTVYDRPDFDAEIAAALKTRQELQARYDKIKNTYDTCALIDAKVALANADRRLRELRGKKAAAQSIESPRSSAVFYGTNG
jgi:hypothetical protein